MILIVDYDAGNLRSVKRAFDAIRVPSELCRDPDRLIRAERIVFPGVGAAQSAMLTLKERGLAEALTQAFRKGTPILGICLGAQIVLTSSEEGPTEALGFIPGTTRRFRLPDPSLKVPHIGWNQVNVVRPHPLLRGFPSGNEYYFVHAYYPAPTSAENVYCESDYGGPFASAVGKDNLFATQFHPEKSGRFGLSLLEQFSSWEGSSC